MRVPQVMEREWSQAGAPDGWIPLSPSKVAFNQSAPEAPTEHVITLSTSGDVKPQHPNQ